MQQVIIYRNPLEAQMWETYYNNPEYFLYGIGVAIILVAVLIYADKIATYFKNKRLKKTWNGY